MKRSDYISINEAAISIHEASRNPFTPHARNFLSAADDDVSKPSSKHVAAAAVAIAKHHPDWDTAKAGAMGSNHFLHTTSNEDAKNPADAMESASKDLGIHKDLHAALMGHMYHTYGHDEVHGRD